MKITPEITYQVVNDDGTEVSPDIAQKVNEIVRLMRDSKILGEGSTVNNNVCIRIASAILNNYVLRKKKHSNNDEEG